MVSFVIFVLILYSLRLITYPLTARLWALIVLVSLKPPALLKRGEGPFCWANNGLIPISGGKLVSYESKVKLHKKLCWNCIACIQGNFHFCLNFNRILWLRPKKSLSRCVRLFLFIHCSEHQFYLRMKEVKQDQ